MKNTRLRLILGSIILAVFVATVFQNCGLMRAGFETADLSSSSVDLASTHPMQMSPTQSTQKMQIANRSYVAELLREIFTSDRYPVPELENLIHQWVINRDAQYGLGCDPYSTYSGMDCGGDISAANLPYTMDDNTVRQSYRMQACDGILASTSAVSAALEKLSVSPLEPDAESIRQIYELFYRGDGAPEEVVQALLTMDQELAAAGEPVPERWRALLLQVCQSPGWQLL